MDNAVAQVGGGTRVAESANAISCDDLAPGGDIVRVELDSKAKVHRIVAFDVK